MPGLTRGFDISKEGCLSSMLIQAGIDRLRVSCERAETSGGTLRGVRGTARESPDDSVI